MFRRTSSDSTARLTLGGVLIALSLMLIIADTTGILRPVEQITSTILGPMGRATFQLGSNLGRFSDFWRDNQRLRDENAQLRQELQSAVAEQGKVAALANQVDQLERQLDFRRNPTNRKFNTVDAEVVSRDATGNFKAITINKGTNDNLTRGMPVVDPSGYLVGRIMQVETKQSKVLLISDSNIGVNIYTQRYGPDNKRIQIQPVDGTAVGQYQLGTEDKVKIDHIKPEADVKVDDWVFTSGIGNTYPQDLLIGKISRIINQDGQPEKQAIVRPIADLDHLQQVLVITSWGAS
ncbi:MAG TPA: rod shape-determining protein MreC [Chloroflexia bacterium]|nr:rod shape-determining protein MreC [Chloroflexia bacterium]